MEVKPTPAQILRRILVGLLVGVAAGYFIFLSRFAATIISVVVAGLMLVIKDSRRWQVLVLIFLSLGMARAAYLRPAAPRSVPYEQKTEFIAWVSEAPLLDESRARYIVTPEDKNWQRILVSARRQPVYAYGFRLKIVCELRPTIFPYWNERNIFSECSYPQITVLPGEAGSAVRRGLYNFRAKLANQLVPFLPEPHLSLIAGIIWGGQADLPQDLKASFRRTGTTHILAVSGFNVTTLTTILFTILIALGLRRPQASVALVILIATFVVFTGAEASVLRAGLMGGLVVAARLVGRAVKPWQLLLLAASGMLIIWPRLLVDLGWQLSFLAMMGLVYLSPIIEPKFKWLPEVLGLRQVAAETMAATAATLPLILLRIDNLSLVSPLANLLIVPAIPWIMLGGLILLVSSILGPVAFIIAWPIWVGLSYIQLVVLSLGNLSWIYLESSVWAWVGVSAIYILGWRFLSKQVINSKKI